MTLRVRWLGRVAYRDAHALQRTLHAGTDDHLLLLEHDHVYTMGVRADPAHLLVPPDRLGAPVVRTDRGGDVTYHGPGQLVGYPVLTVPGRHGGGLADTVEHVRGVEQVVIDALGDLGLRCGRLDRYPGVWVDPEGARPRKIAAVGVRLTRGRSMHGFACNVDPDLERFARIVPCGIDGLGVTSLAAEGVQATMRDVAEAVVRHGVARWGAGGVERADVAWRSADADLAPFSRGEGPGRPVRLTRRLDEARAQAKPAGDRDPAGPGAPVEVALAARKPDWLRAPVRHGPEVLSLRRTLAELSLVTVCEEAGCPNLSECWADGTATFMINGDRCTRACGFCLVDTRRPGPLDPAEPDRVARAVQRLGLRFAVVTAVARDDLADGGAAAFAATVDAIRARNPRTAVEVLIPDLRGDPDALATVLTARPDVVNHNLETVARLQRAVRPSAGYARSLSVLARAHEAGATTKSSLMVGIGETPAEMRAALADLHAVGVDIVTIGQYLRPTSHHLPVARYWEPAELAELAEAGHALGIAHVEAGPLVRSSYHARQAAASAQPA